MILLDTHVWVWWVHRSAQLSANVIHQIQQSEEAGLGVSIISCWEVAKLVEKGRLELPLPLEEWLTKALGYPGVVLLDLTPRIIGESIALPGTFHRDPCDQLLAATARVYQFPLLTADRLILGYAHVETLSARG